MKEYKIRIYRDNFNRDRWQTFTISYKESDLCIGIDTASYVPEMNLFAGQILRELRLEMDAYITNDPTYAVILSPYFPAAGAPGILVRMAEAAATAGVGPMAAVAGAIAEYIGRRLKTEYDCREVIVENGGDIYADIVEGMDIPVFAGQSPLSEKVGIFIPEGGRISICTSSDSLQRRSTGRQLRDRLRQQDTHQTGHQQRNRRDTENPRHFGSHLHQGRHVRHLRRIRTQNMETTPDTIR